MDTHVAGIIKVNTQNLYVVGTRAGNLTLVKLQLKETESG